jgi:uncharacterized sulfatase
MRILLLLGALFGLTARLPAETLPNFLILLADDCTKSDLGLYGGQAATPNLARLAGEGLRFTHCFQAAPMCSPTRHALYTGLYPVKSGAYPNSAVAHEWVRSIAHYLQAAGYITHLSGKLHVGPPSVYPFETSSPRVPDPAALEGVLARSQTEGRPFLFIAASREPHSPWTQGDPSAYPPATLELPPVWVDTPETRAAYSSYLAEITYFDAQVGEFLVRLERAGRSGDTLVLVLSEQGSRMPFAKWTCYDAGLASACLVRWPGRIAPGTVSEALIEYVDVVPTLLEAAGLARPPILDGRSFLAVLTGAATTHKSHVFALQTSRGIEHGPEHFAIRAVRDARYLYIWNLTPEVAFESEATQGPLFRSWERRAESGDERAKRQVEAYRHRPSEELYDCQADPWNQVNLAGDESLATLRTELRARLEAWMTAQGDEGQATELRALERVERKKRPLPNGDEEE